MHPSCMLRCVYSCTLANRMSLHDVCLFAIQAVHCDFSCWASIGLQDKVQAILDKAMFQPSPLSTASLQVCSFLLMLVCGRALLHAICLSSITAPVQSTGKFLIVDGLIFLHVYADTQHLGRARVGICIWDGHSSHDSVRLPACKMSMYMDDVPKFTMRMRSAVWVSCSYCCCCNVPLSSCCRIKSGESEEIKIPRAPPRISADRLSDHIIKSLKL